MGNARNAFIAALTLLGGCIGAPDAGMYERSASGLVEVPADTVALTPLDENGEDWHLATVGCEGLLTDGLHFRLASAEAGLIAAVDSEEHIVCVDTVEAIQEELEACGQTERADALLDEFLLGAGFGELANPLGWAMGDPTPQPSMELAAGADVMSGTERDPTPQPSKSR